MMEYIVTFSESFLQWASVPDSPLTALHEYKFVNVITVFIAKDAMQIKLGLFFIKNRNNLLEVKLKIDSKSISDNPGPHKQVLKNNEWEVLCITIADNKLSIPYTVNHLTKSISGEETAKKMSNQAI